MKQIMNMTAAMMGTAIYKAFAVILVTMAAECGWLYCCFRTYGGTEGYEAGDALATSWIFLGGVVAVTVLFALVGRDASSHPQYTVKRLHLSQRQLVFGQILYQFCVYLILWFAQVAVALGYCLIYSRAFVTEAEQAQYLYLTIYRTDFLYKLLPLEDWIAVVAILVTFLALSVTAAYSSFCNRKGENNLVAPAAVLILVVSYLGSVEWNNSIPILPNLYYGARGLLFLGTYSFIAAAIALASWQGIPKGGEPDAEEND